jgi:hypothetical protein
MGPCIKQTVKCTIVDIDSNTKYIGTNYCKNPQTDCPRKDMPTGVGYELCKKICNQVGHAEEVAANLVKTKIKNGYATIEGHTYACDKCKQILNEKGIHDIRIL